MPTACKKILSIMLSSLFFTQLFPINTFATAVLNNGGGGSQLAYQATYSPDQSWMCTDGEYFFDKTDLTHKCRYQPTKAINDFTGNYTIKTASAPFGMHGITQWISSDTFSKSGLKPHTGTMTEIRDFWGSFFPSSYIDPAIEIYTNGVSWLYAWFSFYDFFTVEGEKEYLVHFAADDDFELYIDNEEKLKLHTENQRGGQRGWEWPYQRRWLYPISFSSGTHAIEIKYSNTITGTPGGVYTELIGPFEPGTFINADGTRKTAQEIKDFLLSSGTMSLPYPRGGSTTVPKVYGENIAFSTSRFLSADKKQQMISYAPNRPGYYCPDGQKPFFKKTQTGGYETEPYCYGSTVFAEPNPSVSIAQGLLALTGGNLDSYELTGACRDGLGDVAITISGASSSKLMCDKEKRSLNSDFDLLPEGKLVVDVQQLTGFEHNGTLKNYASPVITGSFIKDTYAPEIRFSTPSLLCEYRKSLTGEVSDATSQAHFDGFAIVGADEDCSQVNTWQTTSQISGFNFALSQEQGRQKFSFDFAQSPFNNKKLCIKASDAYSNTSFSASTAINGIATCDPSIHQLPIIISRKNIPLDLGKPSASYQDNQNLTFQGDITHNADQIGLDLSAPQKGDYTLTYTAKDIHQRTGTAQRQIHIVDADPLKEQLDIANTPRTIRNKTRTTIDYMFKVRDEVQLVYDNPHATQSDIDQAAEYLKDAIAKLRNKANTPTSPSQPEIIEIKPLPMPTPNPSPEPKSEPEEPKREEKSDSPVQKYEDNEIYNPTIENGKCYNRRTYLGIKDSETITTTEEFKKALSFLWSYEMTMFDSVDRYAPRRNLSREEAAKIFSNFAINVLCRKPDLNLHTNYSDTTNANATLKPYIELAYQLGIMKGSGKGDGNFRPKDFISKAEVNAVLIRMILKSYLDESQSLWYSEYNRVATALGIITQGAGVGTVSRNDVALMLFRAYKNQVFDWQNVDYWTYVLESRGTFVR